MTTLDKRILIHAPPARVFAFLERLDRMPQWMPGALRAEWEQRAAADRPGILHEILGIGDNVLESRQEAVTHAEPLAIGLRQLSGDFGRYEARIEALPSEGNATILHLKVDLEAPEHLHGATIDRTGLVATLSRDLDHALVNAKELLEGRRHGG